jgi:hypothetical protein
MLLPLVYGEYQGERFDRIKGQCDLVYRGGQFYLYATVDIPKARRSKLSPVLEDRFQVAGTDQPQAAFQTAQGLALPSRSLSP